MTTVREMGDREVRPHWHAVGTTGRTAAAAKRGLDIAGALAALVLFGPLMLLIALAVRADGGPVIFGQVRIGHGGRAFRCLKFRTMCVDADRRLAELLRTDPDARAEWEANHKLRNDPRITRVGRFLRKSSLDELPQVFNVLLGDMSLVGPRPIVRSERRRYGDHIRLYERWRPGMTGLWQVEGRSLASYPERVRMDAWYAENRSLYLDVALLIRTVPVVFCGRGAC
jgi:undecaprenyl-phosphate galactose phosphotransferase